MKHTRSSSLHILWAGIALLALVVPASLVFGSTDSKYAGIYSNPPSLDNETSDPIFSVSLAADGSATVTQDCGKGATTSFGRWTDSGSRITITFQAEEGRPADAPMLFRPSQDGLQAVTWNHSVWGKLTPPLIKKDDTKDTNWHAKGSGKRVFGFL